MAEEAGMSTIKSMKKEQDQDLTVQLEGEDQARTYLFGTLLRSALPLSNNDRLSKEDGALRPLYTISQCEERQKPTVLLPAGLFLTAWGVVINSCVIYSLVTTMFFLAFERPGYGMWVVDVVVWAIFVVDIAIVFNSAYEDEDGAVVISRKAVAWKYLKTWLCFDLLAIIPVQFADYPEIEYYFRMVRLFKITKALNLMEGKGMRMITPIVLRRIFHKHSFLSLAQRHTATVISLFLYIAFGTYSMACIWFWFSEKTKEVETNYLSSLTSFADKMPGTNSWEKMQRSWYFMITTLATIGYGDLDATNVCEVFLLIFVLVVGVTSYSYILGQINFIVSELNTLEGDRVGDFVMWLKLLEAVRGKLKFELKTRLIHAFSLYHYDDRLKSMANQFWTKQTAEDFIQPEDQYLAELPENMVVDIKKYLFSDVFGLYHNYFNDSPFLLEICLHFHPRQFQPEDLIISEGDSIYEVLLQVSGLIAMGPLIDGEISAAIYFEKRCIIGDYSGLRGIPCFTNYKAMRPTLLFGIPVQVMNIVLDQKYPELAIHLHAKATQRFNDLTKLLKEHVAKVKKQPQLDTKFWLPRVERILQRQKIKSLKQQDFVCLTQRKLLKVKVSDEVKKFLATDTEKTQKWKNAMAHVSVALGKWCEQLPH